MIIDKYNSGEWTPVFKSRSSAEAVKKGRADVFLQHTDGRLTPRAFPSGKISSNFSQPTLPWSTTQGEGVHWQGEATTECLPTLIIPSCRTPPRTDFVFFSFIRWKLQSPQWRWQYIIGLPSYRRACRLPEWGLATFPFWVACRGDRTADVLLSDCQYCKGTALYGQCRV